MSATTIDGTNINLDAEQEKMIALNLIERGQALSNNVEHFIQYLEQLNQPDLISWLELELMLINQLIDELKHPHLQQPTYKQWLAYVHHIEEQLLMHENLIAEKVFILIKEMINL